MSSHTALLRLSQIIGNNKVEPPIPAIFPVSRATWYRGIEAGRYPAPIRIAPRCVAWRESEIMDLVEGATK